ncbi:tripartite tricarboxylate transporter TctB family protein [Geminicoccaceae bacterium 1502E]|nr:tripartite tricarboxylate transporter TctB family protein [Geminicoccaceae bacterium 1502E]
MNAGLDLRGLAGAAACLLMAGWALWESQGFSQLGAVFPRAVALAMILAALLLVLRLLRGREPASGPAGGSSRRRLGLLAVAALWVAALPVLGFVAASVAGFLATMAVASFEAWTGRRLLGRVILAVVVVLAFRLLFGELLNVPLPKGTMLPL